MNATSEILGILLLATAAEAIVEYFVTPLFDTKPGVSPAVKAVRAHMLRWAAAGVGIILCSSYDVDILSTLGGLEPIHPLIGWIVSGFIVGRGGNIINDLVSLARSFGGK